MKKDRQPLPVGYLIIGFLLFVAGLLFWGFGTISLTYAILAMIFGGILVMASFKSMKD